jgi:hypothetical protein
VASKFAKLAEKRAIVLVVASLVAVICGKCHLPNPVTGFWDGPN